jgi:eukaryotic-like serine/threonine-protein kinase
MCNARRVNDSATAEAPQIGLYEVLGVVGHGAMGTVYEARHAETQRRVALKTLRVPDPKSVGSIRREVHALRQLNHPGIVPVIEEGFTLGVPWYAMPLLDGPTLRGHLDTVGRATSDAASAGARGDLLPMLRIAERLCDALACLHGEGLIHCDLKPENIILAATDQPVLVDFGFVALFGARSRERANGLSGAVEGTFGYMSPEQLGGRLFDARADLYSLGCILYEMVTGSPVFGGEGWHLVDKHLNAVPVPPSALVPGVPAGLDELIVRLLAKDPRERVGYADDVAAVLERLTGSGKPSLSLRARPYLYRPEMAGRDKLLAELDGLLASAKLGNGNLVFLGAESGAGKTRLAIEVGVVAARRGFGLIAGECLPVEMQGSKGGLVDSPLHPFRPFLEQLSLEHGPHAAAEGEGLSAADIAVLARYGSSVAATVAPQFTALSPPDARQQAVSAILNALDVFAKAHPTFIVLDDLQWADELTLEVVSALARTGFVRSRRLIVLALYRSEEQRDELQRLTSSPGVIDRSLPRLDEGAVGAIVADMLALPLPPIPFVKYLAEQTSCNPFFVAEYLRAAASEGLLTRDGQGRWLVDERAQVLERLRRDLPFPDSLRTLLEKSLANLSDDAKRLVEEAAVYGREIETELLETDLEPSKLQPFEDLRRRGVLEDAGPGRLRFTHDKLRELAYDGIHAERLPALHRAAGERIELRAPSDPRAFARLAHHFVLAAHDQKSFEYLEKAGTYALTVGANRTAADFFQRALDLAVVKETSVEPHRLAAWHCSLGDARFGVGDISLARDAMRQTLATLRLSDPGADSGRKRLLFRELARQISHLAMPGALRAVDDRSRERLLLGARATSRLCECYYYSQDLLAVANSAIVAINLAERAGRRCDVRSVCAQMAYMAGLMRLHPVADRYFRVSREGDLEKNDPIGAGVAMYYEASYRITFCNWDQAADLSDSAIAHLERMNASNELQVARTMRAHVYYYSGDFDQALRLFVAVRQASRDADNAQLEAWGSYAAARSLIAMGQLTEAIGLLRESLRLLETRADQASVIIANGLLAEAASLSGDDVLAEEAAHIVLGLARGRRPAAMTEGRGYEGAASALLTLAARASSRGAAANTLGLKARESCELLRQFARLFPLAEAASLRCDGLLAQLLGKPSRAFRLFDRGSKVAKRLQMPYDEALCHREMAQVPTRNAQDQARSVRAASEMFERLGCSGHLRAMRGLQSPESINLA